MFFAIFLREREGVKQLKIIHQPWKTAAFQEVSRIGPHAKLIEAM
jgi:hypothetical protein